MRVLLPSHKNAQMYTKHAIVLIGKHKKKQEMQDELVAVTYSPETFEAKQQVDRLHKLEKENKRLMEALKNDNIDSLQNQIQALVKQVAEAQTQYKALQEYTKTLDKDYQDLLLKSKSAAK